MVRAKKKTVTKKSKSDRLTLKGWADGWRAAFLEERVRRYADAFEAGHDQEGRFLKDLYQEYFYYCPVSVPDHEEPVLPEKPWDSQAILAAENLSDEAMVVKRERMTTLKKRIRGFLRYRAQKLAKVRSSLRYSALDDPYAVLLAKLSGITKPPKARQPFQQWWTANKESVARAAKADLEAQREALRQKNVPESRWPTWSVHTHSEYARRMFKAMPKAEQDEWGVAAKAEAAAEKAAYTAKLTSPASQDPKERAARIENMVSFLAPIIEGVHELTGLHVIVSAAGPMPHRGGEHTVISAASGLNHDPEPVAAPHWRSDPEKMADGRLRARGYGAWREHLLDWCGTAYTPGEVAAATIPGSIGTESRERLRGSQESAPTVEKDRPMAPMAEAVSLNAKVVERMAEDNSDEDFDEDDFDSDKSSDEEEEEEPGKGKKKGKGRTGGGRKKHVEEKENEALVEDEFHDHTGRRLSQYEIDRNAKIKSNKALLAQMMGDTELPWQKAQREKALSDAAKKAEAVEARRENRAKQGPVHAIRKSSRINATQPDTTSQDGGFTASDDDAMDIDASVPGEMERPGEPAMPLEDDSALPVRMSVDESQCAVGAGSPSPDAPAQPHPAPSSGSPSPNAAARPRPAPTGAIVSRLSQEMKAAIATAPDWFRLPYRHFNEALLGKEWRALLDTFVLLEVRGDFSVASGSVATKLRPQLLSDWQKRGRHSKKDEVLELALTGIAAFEKTYTAWWGSMQPEWRMTCETGWLREEYGEEWGVLKARGVLGWLSIVACLFWWGGAVTRGRKVKERVVWVEAVVDAEWMMRGVLQATAEM